jgi:anti-sigma regulatory factor (Ser/Thr protein kinase)
MCGLGLVWTRDFPDGMAALRERNHFLSLLQQHEGWGLNEEAARVVFTELVANAARHGRGPVRVSVTCDGNAMRLGVSDCGPGFNSFPPRPTPLSEGGRGLYIVSQYAEDVRLERSKDRNTVVATLSRSR